MEMSGAGDLSNWASCSGHQQAEPCCFVWRPHPFHVCDTLTKEADREPAESAQDSGQGDSAGPCQLQPWCGQHPHPWDHCGVLADLERWLFQLLGWVHPIPHPQLSVPERCLQVSRLEAGPGPVARPPAAEHRRAAEMPAHHHLPGNPAILPKHRQERLLQPHQDRSKENDRQVCQSRYQSCILRPLQQEFLGHLPEPWHGGVVCHWMSVGQIPMGSKSWWSLLRKSLSCTTV